MNFVIEALSVIKFKKKTNGKIKDQYSYTTIIEQ